MQTVRLSLVEGDVRVSRGKEGEKETGAEWEKAELNLPIEPGFSLATGKGSRAEIEFEDASTMYLGENSAMSFGELTSKASVTHSVVELISGTLTLNLHPNPGEWFKMRTPGGGQFTVPFPDHSLTRLNRYLDATAVTPLEDTTMQMLSKVRAPVEAGKTIMVQDGADGVPVPRPSASYKAWDAWVLDRVKVREELMAQVMGQSGLTSPLAGLPDLEGQGNFFDCAPYGRCWEPAKGWGGASDAPQQAAAAANPQTVSVSALQAQQAQHAVTGTKTTQGQAATLVEEEPYFPCGPNRFDLWWRMNALQPYPMYYRNSYPWMWAVCHSGSWIRQPHRYVWVAEGRRRHHPPIRWVKVNGRPAFVPEHPRDEKGKAPLNAKYGLFAVKLDGEAKHGSVERLPYSAGEQVKVLASMPKEFNKPYFAPLTRMEAPRVEARMSSDAFRSAASLARTTGTPITFDHKSQSFVATHQEMQGGRSVAVAQPIGGGPSAAHSSGSAAVSHSGSSGGYSGGGGGGAPSHSSGGSSTGSNSAGASHSSGSAPAASSGSSGAPSSPSGGGKPH